MFKVAISGVNPGSPCFRASMNFPESEPFNADFVKAVAVGVAMGLDRPCWSHVKVDVMQNGVVIASFTPEEWLSLDYLGIA